jgi:TrpR-related protein YerC/YecD
MARKTYSEGAWRSDPLFRQLCRALAACETERDVADFLRDVGTLSELKAWSERYEVARRIADNEPYRDIAVLTGASTATVTRVARFLYDGAGGYKRAIQTMNSHHHASPARGKRMVAA